MFHHVLVVPTLPNPQQRQQLHRQTMTPSFFPSEPLSKGTTCFFVEDSSMVNYSHQDPMPRLRKLQGKREKEAQVASLGRSRFHFKLPIRCQSAVAVPKRLWWYSWGCWMRRWGCWCGGCFMRTLCVFLGRNIKVSQERVGEAQERDKEFHFRVSDSQSDTLDLLHMAPALTDSGFLNDFHLKPTPVTANRARLHTVTAASEWCSAHHGHLW